MSQVVTLLRRGDHVRLPHDIHSWATVEAAYATQVVVSQSGGGLDVYPREGLVRDLCQYCPKRRDQPNCCAG